MLLNLEKYKIYVLEKKNPYFDKEKNITKDGIHIIIPNVITKTNLQLFWHKFYIFENYFVG